MSKIEASVNESLWFYDPKQLIETYLDLGVIKLRDLLSFSPIDILIKSADQKSYHAILQELKDKEVYNIIIDIHDTDNMSDFLKAVGLIYYYIPHCII